MKTTLGLLVLAMLWGPVPVSHAQDGTSIMKKVLNKANWKDMKAKVTLTITSASGSKRIRKIDMMSRKRTDDESDMLMRFTEPADVRGTAFLIIEHATRDDDRYLYLPALRRIKRIASSGKGGNFMSSDFTYYDIGKPKLADWKYRLVKSVFVDGIDCYIIEARPASPELAKDIGYQKIFHWVDKSNYTIIHSEYYDRLGKKWKILTVPGLKKINGVWFQTHLVMKDIQAHRSSEFEFTDIKVNVGIPASTFTKRALSQWH